MNTLFQPFSFKEREKRWKTACHVTGSSDKSFGSRPECRKKSCRPGIFPSSVFPSGLFSLYATSLWCLLHPKPPPMNFPGATAFLLLFPFPTGVCFYCMPRCLSFQKTNGHDEQQKQRPEALGKGVAGAAEGLAGRNATEMDFCYYYCRWSRLLNFIALQWTAPWPNLVNKWNEMNGKLMRKKLQRKKHIRNTFQDSFVIFL